MTDEINVVNRSQTIFVEPSSGAVSVIGGGPPGPAGPQGAQGIQGAQGPAGAAGAPGGGTMTPLGIIASGASVATPALNALLTLSTVLGGKASWLASNTITLPAGSAGLYNLQLEVMYRSDAVVGVSWEVANNAGAAYSPNLMTTISHTVSVVNARYQSSWLRQCADGDSFQVRYRGNALTGSGFMQIMRFSLVRLGTGFAP
jgi:hypothetical protein